MTLSWLRRDRAPGSDNWDQTEIPMSETIESYDLEILDAAGTIVRTMNALASPSFTYAAADIAADFASGLPQPFRFNVYQISSTIGRGAKATAAITL